MPRIRFGLIGLAMSAAAALVGCNSANNSGGSATRLNGGGSTFVYPMMTTWADEYRKANHVEVNYQSIGSGGGIQQMTAKTFDFGCTDGPMNQEQLEKVTANGGEAVHIPLVMGAVVPAYTLKNVKEQLVFSGPVLADIYLSKIKKWSDPAIKKLNPNVNLPELDIAVVHRADGSGTTYIWADYLSKVSPEWKQKVGVGTSLKWPCGVGQKGNEAVARQTKQTEGAIGYVELTYALQTGINYGSVINKAGKTIKPSLESVTAAANSSLKDIPDDLRYSITNAPGDDAYPISGTTWAVIYNKLPKDNGKTIVDFLRWCTHDGQQFLRRIALFAIARGFDRTHRQEARRDQGGRLSGIHDSRL